MISFRLTKIYLLGGLLALGYQPPIVFSQASTVKGKTPSAIRDGQGDFDFNIGTWKTHVSRLKHPLTNSNTWAEYNGLSDVRKVWNGRASFFELEVDGPEGHIEGVGLRLYNPESHQWSLNWALQPRWSHDTARHRRIQRWARRVLRSGNIQWQNHHCPKHVLEHFLEFVSL
jgi:hypothetical protein